MKQSVLKRISALEQMAVGRKTPTLIMIHYEDDSGKWLVREHFCSGSWKDSSGYRSKEYFADRLQDIGFCPEFDGKVILKTFGCKDPVIYGNLFHFDIGSLRQGVTDSDTRKIYIDAITLLPDGDGCEILACTKPET